MFNYCQVSGPGQTSGVNLLTCRALHGPFLSYGPIHLCLLERMKDPKIGRSKILDVDVVR